MRISVYLPLLASLLAAVGAPYLSKRLAPRSAVILLTVCGAVLALATTWSLVMIGTAGLSRTVEGLAFVHSPVTPAQAGQLDPVPRTTGVLAAGALTVCVARLIVVLWRRFRVHAAMVAMLAAASGSELVVFEGAIPHAYAVAAGGGRIVVSDGMLRALDAQERRVLFAHERSHLAHRHDRFACIAEFSAAVNPLLIPLGRAIRFQIERWADEDAAAQVGSRNLVARALARASQARATTSIPILAFVREGVTERVQALMTSGHLTRARVVLMVVAAALTATALTIDATTAFVQILGRLG